MRHCSVSHLCGAVDLPGVCSCNPCASRCCREAQEAGTYSDPTRFQHAAYLQALPSSSAQLTVAVGLNLTLMGLKAKPWPQPNSQTHMPRWDSTAPSLTVAVGLNLTLMGLKAKP